MNIKIVKPLKIGISFSSSILLTTMIAASASAQNNNFPPSHSANQQVVTQRHILTNDTQSFVYNDGTYQIQVDGQKLSRKRNSDQFIHLKRGGPFDPLQKSMSQFSSDNQAKLPELYSPGSQSGNSTYIVQFHTQAMPDYQAAIKVIGGTIATTFPPNSVLLLIDSSAVNQVKKLPSVRAVVPFLPIYKLQEGLENVIANDVSNEFNDYSVMAIGKQYSTQLAQFVKQIGGEIISSATSIGQSSRLSVKLTPSQLLQISQHALLLYVDQLGEVGEDVDDVREREGFNWLESVAGYTGKGVGIEVYDRGFQIDHQELANTPNPILVRSPQAEGSGGADHGTDISGILFAQGVNAKYRGIIPDAARPIVFSRYSGFSNAQPNESELRGHLAELVDPNGPYRAVVQTSSTDYAVTLDYTTWSAEYDEVLFDLDLLKTQSQSNTKNQTSRPAAWAKNIVAVGGIKTYSTLSKSDDGWGTGASIGPAADDRIKPDLSGQYDSFDMIADGSGSTYNSRSGTSFSTPAVSGAFGILYQMWADGIFDGGPGKQGAPEFRDVFDVRPHASTAKAIMIHTAFQYTFDTGDSHDLSRIKQGWGFPDLQNLYQTAKDHGWRLPILINEDDVLLPGATNVYTMTMDGTKPLKATMVYKDPRGNPAAAIARINDLSLKVTSPTGVIYWGNNGLRQGNWSSAGGTSNTVDTVENVFIQTPQSGIWTIEVLGDDIVQDGHVQTSALDADYALIATGGVSANTAPVANAGVDSSVQIPNALTLNGSVTDDSFPGKPLTSTWSKLSGPGNVTFANVNAQSTSATFSLDGAYVLRLTASDTEFTHQDDVSVTVSPAPQNLAPVADAGVNQSIELPAAANLVGSCSDDGLPVGATVSASWSGNGVTFSNANATSTSASFSSAGSYTVTLTCSDTELNGNNSAVITVANAQPNQAPTVNAGTDFNAIVASSINLSGTASDDGKPAGGSLTTSWLSVSGPGSVTFGNANSLTSSVSFSAEGNYVLSLTANDGALSSVDEVNVSVSAIPTDLTNDSFETDLGNWNNPTAGDNYDWTRDSGGTPSSSTGPSSGANGSTWYMFLETSNGSGAYTAGDSAILESTAITGSNRQFDFDYHMYGANMGTLNVEVSQNGGAWINVWTLSGQQQTANSAAYKHATINLSSYNGSLKVRFLAVAAGNYRGDMAIDNPVMTGLNTPPGNQAPVVDAGAAQTISLPSDATLSGSCTDDGLPNGSSLACTWSAPAGVSFANANSATTTASFTAAGTYQLTLSGSDGTLSSTDTVTMTVNSAPINQAPVANAGADVSGNLTSSLTLSGSCVDDGLPQGNSVSATWAAVSGVTYANANSATTTATFSAVGSYHLSLTCSDGVLSGNDSLTATISDAPSGNVLANGVATTDIAGAAKAQMFYTLAVPVGATNLQFNTAGGTGDADLYVQFATQPSLTVFDCKSTTSSNNETCTISNVQAGTYHVMVEAWSAITGVSLTGSFTEPGTNPPGIISQSDFESSLGDWSNASSGDSHDWTRDSAGTPSSSTGPSVGANSSSYYVYLETSNGSGAFNSGNTAYLESVDLTGSNRSFTFDYHLYGADIGTLAVDVQVNGSWTNNVWSLSSQQQTNQADAYQQATVNLSSYTGTIKLRLRATAVGGWKGDMAIDNLVVTGD